MNDIIEVNGIEKIKFRSRDLMKKSLLPQLINKIEQLDYKLYVHASSWGAPKENTFTIIITSHGNNVDYFKQSIGSVLKQTVNTFELILVDHGCEPELRNLIREYFNNDNRIKLLVFNENLYNPKVANFLEERLFSLINAAIFCSEGDYFFFLSYDDILSNNYIECMLRLFLENENCVVASPNIASINEFSEINEVFTNSLRQDKIQKRYMCGLEMAISTINGSRLFSAPGSLFCFRTTVVLANGGLDCTNDTSQLFKYGLLGDIGTDNNACLNWRHHQNQTNKQNELFGGLYYGVYISWLKHLKNFLIVKNIEISYQILFANYMDGMIKNNTLRCIKRSINLGPTSAFNIFLSVIKEAPLIYVWYYAVIFFQAIPWLLYNSLPNSVKNFYRALKKILLSNSIRT
jgi:GT2 family glycosyltransferase